jgi:hypothetical protein
VGTSEDSRDLSGAITAPKRVIRNTIYVVGYLDLSSNSANPSRICMGITRQIDALFVVGDINTVEALAWPEGYNGEDSGQKQNL